MIRNASTRPYTSDFPLSQEPEYLTMTDACLLSGHSRQWIHTRVERGAIHRYSVPGSEHPMYLSSEIEAAMQLSLGEAVTPQQKSTLPEYYSIPYIASRLGVTRAYVWQFVHAGEIPAINISGKVGRGAMWRIRKEDAEKFITSRQTNVKGEEHGNNNDHSTQTS